MHCTPYSSDSQTNYFAVGYNTQNGAKRLNLSLSFKPSNDSLAKTTDFLLDCTPSVSQPLSNIRVNDPTVSKLIINGESSYVCPVFELSSIWSALTDNLFFFGIILFLVGFIMLFYGILMTHLMIFIAAYFLSFAILFGLFTAFLTPESSSVAIYFSLLLILFLSTLIAYSLTKLVNVSIFFIGACKIMLIQCLDLFWQPSLIQSSVRSLVYTQYGQW